MNKQLIFSALGLLFIITSCGPASENRKVMHYRAKIFQDSIANVIRATIAEAESPAPQTIAMPAQPSPTAAVTATAK